MRPLVETRSPTNAISCDLSRQHAVAKERAELAREQLEEITASDKRIRRSARRATAKV